MRKRSKHLCEITESCRRWDCSMERNAEWTFEGESETDVRVFIRYGR